MIQPHAALPAHSVTAESGYRNNFEYIEEGLRLLDLRMERAACRAGVGADGSEVSFRRLRRGEAEPEDIQRRLATLEERLAEGLHRRALRIAASEAEGKVFPLEELAREHDLDDFEKQVVLLALGPSLDPAFGAAMELRGRPPEIRDILLTLCDSLEEKIGARRYFFHDARLIAGRILEISHRLRSRLGDLAFLRLDVELSQHIVNRLLGVYSVDEALVTFSRLIDPEVEWDQVVLPDEMRVEALELVAGREEMLAARAAWGVDRLIPYGKGTVLLFSGPPGTGKTMFAHALAKETGHRLMLVSMERLCGYGDFSDNLRLVFQEARHTRSILFFDEADEIFGSPRSGSLMATLLREFERLDGLAILATNRGEILDAAMERRVLRTFHFSVPAPALRERIWRNLLPPDAPLADDVDCAALAEEFDFSGGYIKNAVLVALHRAVQRPPAERRITQADLVRGARQQRRQRLGRNTDLVAPRATLDDLVLPPETLAQVRRVASAAVRRRQVRGDWGVGGKSERGRAVTALFIGAPGTGKTFAAEAVAQALGLPLFSVDLAAVVSPLVGETGKRLAMAFREAKEAGAVLFFDEADALFARRLSGGGHHAHYINQEINGLLTALERHDGVVLLATNRPEALDEAFERRLRYRVDFPAPDAAGRERIWRGLVSERTPLAPDVDFAALARRHVLTGGAIHNAMLRAAGDAASDGGVITAGHLEQACRLEKPLVEKRVMGFGGSNPN